MRIAILTAGMVLLASAAAATPPCDDASAIVRSFVENRFNRDESPDPNACYWQARRVSIYNSNPETMTVGEPVVVAGSGLNHDTNTPIDLGTNGWLNATDSKDRLARGEVLAWIDGERVEVLTSGQPSKWESFINPNNDSIIYTCDEYFANEWGECENDDGSPCPSESREPDESCWAVTFGVDLSQLPVGTHVLRAIYYGSYGNGPADYPAALLEITKEITVNP